MFNCSGVNLQFFGVFSAQHILRAASNENAAS
jgi:hypothetical protein